MDIFTENRVVKKKSEIGVYLFLILVSFSVAIYTQLPALKSEYIINDDVRQHIYWMAQFNDPQLFKDDIYFQYADYLAPWGYKSFYFLLSFLFSNPIYVGKILGILLYVLSSIYIFRLAKSMQDTYMGITAFVLFVFFPVHILGWFVGGLERAFAYPLLLLFIYYLYHFRIGKCVLILILQILFYPVIAILSYTMLLVILYFWFKKIRRFYTPKRLLVLIFAPLLLFIIFICVKQATKPEFLGELVTKKEMYQDKAFWKGGRDPYLPIRPSLTKIIKSKFLFHTSLWFFMGLCIIPFIPFATSLGGKNREEIRKYQFIFVLFLISIMLYKAAEAFLFKMYAPKRYTEFSLPLVHIFLVSNGVGICISACRTKYAKMIGMAVFLAFAWWCHKGSIKQGIGCKVWESKRAPLYRYLASLPKTSLIAANPFLSDNIKTFSQRKVFITYEQAQHWFKGYAAIIDQRAMDFFKMYYSDSGREVYEICKANGIEYLVIHLDDFSPRFLSNEKFLYEPLNRHIAHIVSEKENFFLPSLEERKILYRLGNYLVVKADEATLLK